MSVTSAPQDHDAPADVFAVPPPLAPAAPAPRRSPGEEARTLVAGTRLATLATLSEDGTPWASLVMYGELDGGVPVLCVSTLAEHGRNLERDPRASLMVATTDADGDPLAKGRVTIAGRVTRPTGDRERAAHDAFVAAVPIAEFYTGFGDFSLWVLEIERVRWVGGYGVMDSADPASYRAAEPDPVAPHAPFAVRHLNEDHADALLAMARALAGYTDATAATCTGADRYGLELLVETPRGKAPARVAYAERVDAADGLRAATAALARRARGDAQEPEG